jgi:formylglycine-generating enzyme required for sulfatase activity
VPIDKRTGEPNPTLIIRPPGRTPLETLLKPGDYLIEAVLTGNSDSIDFAEEYGTVPSGAISQSERQSNLERGYAEDGLIFNINIRQYKDVVARMVAVPVADNLRRKNPLLSKLLYVDAQETKPRIHQPAKDSPPGMVPVNGNGQVDSITWEDAMSNVRNSGRRLPSAAEYDAIVHATNNHELLYVGTGQPATLNDLIDGVAEWTTTKYEFSMPAKYRTIARNKSLQVLKGYDDPDKILGAMRTPDGPLIAPEDTRSPFIGYRGVRSGAPRFLNE